MIPEYAEADLFEGAAHVPGYLLDPDEPAE